MMQSAETLINNLLAGYRIYAYFLINNQYTEFVLYIDNNKFYIVHPNFNPSSCNNEETCDLDYVNKISKNRIMILLLDTYFTIEKQNFYIAMELKQNCNFNEALTALFEQCNIYYYTMSYKRVDVIDKEIRILLDEYVQYKNLAHDLLSFYFEKRRYIINELANSVNDIFTDTPNEDQIKLLHMQSKNEQNIKSEQNALKENNDYFNNMIQKLINERSALK